MRRNAYNSALLSLAVLSLLSATLLAQPRPKHKTQSHSQTLPAAPRIRSHSKSAREAHSEQRKFTASLLSSERKGRSGSRAHQSVHENLASRKATKRGRRSSRSHADVAESRPSHQLARATDEPATSATPRKATVADFLQAASADTAPAKDTPKAITGTSAPPDDDETAPRVRPSSPKISTVARPIPVISVIRPTPSAPQLESVEQAAATPLILPALYNKRGRLIMPAPLKGSHEILVRQNQVADREGLDRIQNDDDIAEMRRQKALVALPVNAGMHVDDRLDENRRFCRPWTAQFLQDLARAHYARFHTPLQINSAVRTVEFQHRLLRTNGNAAPAEGDTASPHLTGQTVDLAKHGLSLTEIAWMRGYLLPLVQQGKVDVEEEFQQSCFHISVYKRYLPPAYNPNRNIATHRSSTTSSLAASMP